MLKKRLLTTAVALAVLAIGWLAGIEIANAQSNDKLVDKYATLAGSEANARTLVSGLRSGSDFTISGATFKTPTGKMGGGEVNIALSLTRAELDKQDIAQPTSQQLQSALNDILSQRASGKGWGQIANAMGFRLGDVMRSEKAGEHARDVAQRERAERPHHERPEKPERPERAGRS